MDYVRDVEEIIPADGDVAINSVATVIGGGVSRVLIYSMILDSFDLQNVSSQWVCSRWVCSQWVCSQ